MTVTAALFSKEGLHKVNIWSSTADFLDLIGEHFLKAKQPMKLSLN